MISQTAEYALQATVYLARNQRPEPVSVGELADALGAPRNYLSKILGALARGGVLTSLRGPSGGFRLAVSPDRLALSRIVGLFDPPPGRQCLMGRRVCGEADPCAAHALWTGVAERVDGFFRETTVRALLEASATAVPAATAGGSGRAKPKRAGGRSRRRVSGGIDLNRRKEAEHG